MSLKYMNRERTCFVFAFLVECIGGFRWFLCGLVRDSQIKVAKTKKKKKKTEVFTSMETLEEKRTGERKKSCLVLAGMVAAGIGVVVVVVVVVVDAVVDAVVVVVVVVVVDLVGVSGVMEVVFQMLQLLHTGSFASWVRLVVFQMELHTSLFLTT